MNIFDKTENIDETRENAVYQQILLFSQCFQKHFSVETRDSLTFYQTTKF